MDVAPDANKELDPSVPPVHVDASQFNGILHKGKDETDSNCWTSPSGKGFMIRGKTYLKDNAKVIFFFSSKSFDVYFSLVLLFVLSAFILILVSSKHEIRFSGTLVWQNEMHFGITVGVCLVFSVIHSVLILIPV